MKNSIVLEKYDLLFKEIVTGVRINVYSFQNIREI